MGQPVGNSGLKIFEAYTQGRVDLGNKSGGVILDMSQSSYLKFTLTGNISSVDTINIPAVDKGVIVNITVIQDPVIAYTIDWLASGDFVSTLVSADLQPGGLGSATSYICIWNGQKFELLIDKEYALPALLEYQKVIARMTSPSTAFQNAIQEYVESEQAASGDNWALTDEIQAFNVDTEVNALTGWKQFDPTISKGAPIFLPYEGYDFDLINEDGLLANFSGTTLPNYSITDAFITALFKGEDTGIAQRVFNDATNGTYIIQQGTGVAATNINSARPISPNPPMIQGEEHLVHNWIDDIPSGLGQYYIDGDYFLGDGPPTHILASAFAYGYRNQTGLNFTDQVIRMGIAGASIGFDQISHLAAVRKFADRMLIAKHQAVVDTVINRYTALSDRETFAISRLVARSEENGNWAGVDEVFMLGLYDKANAKIGMLQYNISLEVGAPIHTPGLGFRIGTTDALETDFNFAGSKFGYRDLNMGAVYHADNYNNPTERRFILGQYPTANRSHLLSLMPDGTNFIDGWSSGRQVVSNRIVLDGYVSFRDINTMLMWKGNTQIGSTIAGGVVKVTGLWMIGNRRLDTTTDNGLDGIVTSAHIGINITDDNLREEFRNDFQHCTNHIEIGQASTIDYNIQDKTYDWSDRELSPDQLEELTTIINSSSNNTTTGRTLDITAHLGITLNAQIQIDNLVNVNGWIVIL